MGIGVIEYDDSTAEVCQKSSMSKRAASHLLQDQNAPFQTEEVEEDAN